VSNRIFNDINANVFSERGVTQWGNVWGQFVDHNIGHRDEAAIRAKPKNPQPRKPIAEFAHRDHY